MGQIWHKFQLISKTVSSFVFLHVAYFIGVGITAIIAKIFGKHFLNDSPIGSTWQKRNKEQNPETMY